MAYPKEVKLSEERENALKMWLNLNITNHRQERSAWVDDLMSWQRDYWAKPTTTVQTFPFHGAANIIIPITGIVYEAVHAKNVTRIFNSLDQLVSLKFFDANWSPFDRDIEKFLDWQILDQMEYKKNLESSLSELELYGTGVMKDGYVRMVKNIMVNGKKVETIQYQGPILKPIPLANFLMPFDSQDPQTAPWCGEEHRNNQFEVRQAEQSGLFRPGTYAKLNTYYTPINSTNLSSNQFVQQTEQLANQVPAWPSRIGWYEIYCAFVEMNEEGKEKGDPIEMVCLYHYDSNTLMSARYLWTEDGRRPYHIGNFIKIPNRWAGKGIAKQQEQFQREITMQHRQRLDAGTIANANMLKVKKLSGISSNEPVFPGKLWFVDEMEDIEPIQFSGTYPAAANNEQQTLYYSQMYSGIHDGTLGMPQVGTPATATSDVARMQEGATKHDYTYHNILDWITSQIKATICNVAYFGASDPRYYSLIPNGDIVEQFFRQPVDLLKSGIFCKISAAAQSDNKLLDRNNWQMLSQIFTQYYQGNMQTAMMIDPKLGMAIGLHSIYASTIAMKKMLESFDIPQSEKLTLEALINGLIPQPESPTGNLGGTQGIPTQQTLSIPASTSQVSEGGSAAQVIEG